MWRRASAWLLSGVRALPFSSRASLVDEAAADGELRVFIVAGEVSGDSIASKLMVSLRRLSPLPVRFSGVGGSFMKKEGLLSLFPIEEIAVMGIWELLPHIQKIKDKIDDTTRHATSFQPHVVITVDSKGFSFRFLRKLRDTCSQQQIRTPLHVHYVAPSFWAWKGGEHQLKGLRTFIDHVLCILPFEEEVCQRNSLAATFVGHPILEDTLDFELVSGKLLCTPKLQGNAGRFLEKNGLNDGQ